MVKSELRKLMYTIRAKMYEPERRLRTSLSSSASGSIIVPAAAPGGAGDDAMVNGAIASIKSMRQEEDISILVGKKFPDDFSFNRTVSNIKLLSGWRHPNVEIEKLCSYKNFYLLGADILDGAYNYPDAMKRIKLARMATELGLNSRIVAFSLNEKPNQIAINEFRKLKSTPIYLRDPLSYNRAKKILDCDIRLSADAAFLLEPVSSDTSEIVEKFINDNKKKGQRVYGLNIHNLFSKLGSPELMASLIDSFTNLIAKCSDCSFVLISHDFRAEVDDREPLRKVFNKLNNDGKSRVCFISQSIRASEIKEICRNLDGVVTGRMHLAIAALGMKTPVLGIVYQGKFEGTLSYFEMDEDCTLTPENAANSEGLIVRFRRWQSQRDELMNRIDKNLEKVMTLSKSNFE